MGILFLIPLITYGVGNGLMMSVMEVPGHLSGVYGRRFQVLTGGMLMFANSVAVMFVGIVVFPVLARFNQKVALAYLSSRILEAVILVVGIVGLLSLVSVSEQYNRVTTPDATYFETLFTLGIRTHFYAYQLAMLALGTGSVMFCGLLYKNRLVPSFLSILGITGYILLMAGAFLELCGYGVGVLLSIPGGIFEVILGIWLITKGFSD